MFTARQLALHAARLASAKGGEGLRVLHLPESSATVFDYAVLVTGRSDRQATTIVEEIFHFCKRHQVPRMPVEGEGGWMLIDCYDVVVHALSAEMRERYDLDRLWPTAREVDWERELKELDDPDRPAAPARKPAARRSARAKAKPEAEPEAKPAPKRRRAAARAPRQQGADADLPATLPPEFEPKPRRRKR
jgi:ribosome-associated protein